MNLHINSFLSISQIRCCQHVSALIKARRPPETSFCVCVCVCVTPQGHMTTLRSEQHLSWNAVYIYPAETRGFCWNIECLTFENHKQIKATAQDKYQIVPLRGWNLNTTSSMTFTQEQPQTNITINTIFALCQYFFTFYSLFFSEYNKYS